MSEVIVGRGADYSTNATDSDGDPSVNTGIKPGATAEEPYTVVLGRMVIRAATQEEIDNFMAWLSNMSGKPIDKLDERDALRHITTSELNSHFIASDSVAKKTFTSFALDPTRWTSIGNFNDTQFFGDDIPEFPPGSGTFFGATLEPEKRGLELDAGLTGFAATAQLIYNSNYPADSTLPAINTAKLSEPVRELLHKMFGADTAFNQGHLNVLKMMNMVTGMAKDQPITEWKLTIGTGVPLLQAYKDNPQTFMPATSLLGLETVDFTKAKGVVQYFDAGGNFLPEFTPADVEKIAAELLGKMSPPETAIPAGTVFGDRVRNTLNSLFGLPSNNNTFTAEQVNTAITMGLVKYNAATSTLSLTEVGRSYITTKNPDGLDPAAPEPSAPTREQHLESLWHIWNFLANDAEGAGIRMIDYLEGVIPDGNGKTHNGWNNNFGKFGVQQLSQLTSDSVHWENAKLGHLSTEQRNTMIKEAKKIQENPLFNEVWENMHLLRGENKIEGAVHLNQVKDWLNVTRDTWKPQTEQFKSRFTDPAVSVPGNNEDFWLPDSIGVSQFTDAEWGSINRICESLFGKKFDQMSQEERKKALYVLSTGPTPLIQLNKEVIEIEDIFGVVVKIVTVLNVELTDHARNYLGSLTPP